VYFSEHCTYTQDMTIQSAQTQCIMPPMFPCVHRIFAERFI